MTDVNPAVNPLFLREEDLRRGMEMLFYAQRDLAEDCAPVLARHGLGRAHPFASSTSCAAIRGCRWASCWRS